MKLVSIKSLERGRVLVDYAYRGDDIAYAMAPADYIGIVAAYIAHGQPTHEMKEQLSSKLGPQIAEASVLAYDTFQDVQGRGLWLQGAANDDIIFTHRKLKAYYPGVQNRWREFLDEGDGPF